MENSDKKIDIKNSQKQDSNGHTSSQKSNNSRQSQQKPNYTIEKVIGQGTFGMVYMAIDANTNEQVAIKKVFQDKRYKNRELQIIKDLLHPNVVRLRNAYYTTEGKDQVYLNLVMDFIPETLSKIVRFHRKTKNPLQNYIIKVYCYQMFRSLAYLMTVGICHRDIKPQNILVNPVSLVLKVCDFGSAKKLVPGEPNVSYICSRYYRAPELIFGATEYTNAIDVWSMSCVICELIIGEPLFPGESAVDQLVEIIKVLGTPTMDQVKAMNPQQTEFKFPQIKAHPWSKVFGKYKVDPQLIDLISKLLCYSPKERPKPLEALLHPYFNDMRTENFNWKQFQQKDKQQVDLPEFLDFSNDELKSQPELANLLIPSWYDKKKSKKQQN